MERPWACVELLELSRRNLWAFAVVGLLAPRDLLGGLSVRLCRWGTRFEGFVAVELRGQGTRGLALHGSRGFWLQTSPGFFSRTFSHSNSAVALGSSLPPPPPSSVIYLS